MTPNPHQPTLIALLVFAAGLNFGGAFMHLDWTWTPIGIAGGLVALLVIREIRKEHRR